MPKTPFSLTKSYLDILRAAQKETDINLASALNSLMDDKDLCKIVEKVYLSNKTDMGDFWLSFLEATDILIQNIHACHTGHLEEYLSSTRDMLNYMMAYNNHDYGRWFPDYWASIISLPEDQYNFFGNNFAQSLTVRAIYVRIYQLEFSKVNLKTVMWKLTQLYLQYIISCANKGTERHGGD